MIRPFFNILIPIQHARHNNSYEDNHARQHLPTTNACISYSGIIFFNNMKIDTTSYQITSIKLTPYHHCPQKPSILIMSNKMEIPHGSPT
jgi:hypothetical protein